MSKFASSCRHFSRKFLSPSAVVVWIFSAAAIGVIAGGCALKPTTGGVNSERLIGNKLEGIEPIRITPETVVIDARNSFEFSTAHIPKSINLAWDSFTEQAPERRGVLLQEHERMQRRLAVLGITPGSSVVVVGNGLSGLGEEGRIAWMLTYLGVEKVQFASLDSLRPRLSNASDSEKRKSVPAWQVEPFADLLVKLDEFSYVLENDGTKSAISFGSGNKIEYRIVDVRDKRDFAGRAGFGREQKPGSMNAINIPWTEFFTKEFRPNPNVLKRVNGAGILPRHRIIVIDDQGVRSGAVTMALRSLGYSRAANLSGGLIEYMRFGQR